MTAARQSACAWCGLAALLALGALLGMRLPAEAIDWQPARAMAEPWRAFTAAFAHLGAAHLWANLAGTLAVAAFGSAAGCTPRDTLAWLAAWPLTHLGLSLAPGPGLNPPPGLAHYAGLSGVLHAGVVVAAFALVARERGKRRAIGALVLAGLLLKLLAEEAWQAPVRRIDGWDFPVAVLAHLSGSLAGLACAAVAWATGPRAAPRTIDA